MAQGGTAPELPAGVRALSESYAQEEARRRRIFLGGISVLFALCFIAGHITEADFGKLAANIGNLTSYFYNILPALRAESLWSDLREWMWGLDKWLALLCDTLLIAYLGMLMGAAGALGLCFVASENLMPNRAARFAARRFLEFCRTVPDLVFALIFVIAFGLGPMAGVLALAIHSAGALGKLFGEAVENVDMNPVSGLRASGASWFETVRFAVLPQVLPAFLGYGLLRFEMNVRAASVIGFVGAGGIGQELLVAIRSFYYSDVSAILLLIILTVFAIDMATGRLRHMLMGRAA